MYTNLRLRYTSCIVKFTSCTRASGIKCRHHTRWQRTAFPHDGPPASPAMGSPADVTLRFTVFLVGLTLQWLVYRLTPTSCHCGEYVNGAKNCVDLKDVPVAIADAAWVVEGVQATKYKHTQYCRDAGRAKIHV